jgi:hypothetical protein
MERNGDDIKEKVRQEGTGRMRLNWVWEGLVVRVTKPELHMAKMLVAQPRLVAAGFSYT